MTRLTLSAFLCLAVCSAMGLATAPGVTAATGPESGEVAPSEAGNGSSQGWVNQRTGVVGTFTDAEPRLDADGRECREYAFTAEIADESQVIYGVACRSEGGNWQEASSSYESESQPSPEPYVHNPWSSGPSDGAYAYPYSPYPYSGYGYPSIGLSASYCFSGICLGSGYSTSPYYGYGDSYYGYGYPSYGYGYRSPYYGYRFGFNYYDGYYKYGKKKYKKRRRHYGNRHGGHNGGRNGGYNGGHNGGRRGGYSGGHNGGRNRDGYRQRSHKQGNNRNRQQRGQGQQRRQKRGR